MLNTSHRYRSGRAGLLLAAVVVFSLLSAGQPAGAVPSSGLGAQAPGIQGPFTGEEASAGEFNGSLVALAEKVGPIQPNGLGPRPLKYTPGTKPKGSAPELDRWIDPVLQDSFGSTLMPGVIKSFEGLNLGSHGSGWPPDTNGDVDDQYYIQTVNTAIGIFNKNTGAAVSVLSFDTLFWLGGTGTPCDVGAHYGDPVVVYDRLADRWLISDFSVGDPYYECIAVSKTGDPVNGGWWLYGVKISSTQLNDYPKVGVGSDAYFFTFNMFDMPTEDWGGVQVWAFDKARLLSGQSAKSVYFALGPDTGYASLLPAHALSAPPAGAPHLLASVGVPNQLLLWKFKPSFSTPELSIFTGPEILPVASFAAADSVPHQGSFTLLDSLSPRPMMQLIYRAINGVESIWLTHSVTNQGVGAMRWYEVRRPSTTPLLYQQGTYQPDLNHRWMGALAVDKDGNMAMGYSIANSNMYPGIRYTGRLAGEIPGQLPQGESTIISGGGSQQSYTRWGDYSSMSVDPVDDCTFWYTTEYFPSSNNDWHTRIASFRFPSCGQPKGKIQGVVRNAVTLQPVANAPVFAQSDDQSMTVMTDANGVYTITLAADTFNLTAGPLLPGYPAAGTAGAVSLLAGSTTTRDLLLTPTPNLQAQARTVNDAQPEGNNNGYAEPGESNLLLTSTLVNSGAITSTQVTARLESLTPGVTVGANTSGYPHIPAGGTAANLSPFSFSVDSSIACASDLQFRKTITDSLHTYTETFAVTAAIPLARIDFLKTTFESGASGWTTGGTSPWSLSTLSAKSPVNAWTDSPSGNYADDADAWLMSPVYNLKGMRGLRVKFWTRYSLEPGYDYVYLEYSLNGGLNWTGGGSSLAILNGVQTGWTEVVIDAPQLDDKPNARLRFRLISDGGVTMDGIYIDDFTLNYQPYACLYGLQPRLWLPFVVK